MKLQETSVKFQYEYADSNPKRSSSVWDWKVARSFTPRRSATRFTTQVIVAGDDTLKVIAMRASGRNIVHIY